MSLRMRLRALERTAEEIQARPIPSCIAVFSDCEAPNAVNGDYMPRVCQGEMSLEKCLACTHVRPERRAVAQVRTMEDKSRPNDGRSWEHHCVMDVWLLDGEVLGYSCDKMSEVDLEDELFSPEHPPCHSCSKKYRDRREINVLYDGGEL